MSYQGGKRRLGPDVYQVISLAEAEISDEKLPYLEPFVGYCGVLQHFAQEKNRVCFACDKNESVILMWEALQKGWKPPKKFSKRKYQELKSVQAESPEKGFVGCVGSFAGIYFGGWKNDDRYITSGNKIVCEIAEKVKNVGFMEARSYTKMGPKGMLIYCDPPYAGNSYGTKTEYFKFDSEEFWETMREWSQKNIVVISENKAPKDFACIWSKERDICHNGRVKTEKECLFMLKSLYNDFPTGLKRKIKNI